MQILSTLLIETELIKMISLLYDREIHFYFYV